MNFLEQCIYLKHTKSGIKSFEKFIDSLMQHDDVISDAELMHTIKRISNKLLTVTNKWDDRLRKIFPNETQDATFSVEVPSDHGCIDDVVCFRKPSHSSTLSSTDIDPKPGCSYTSTKSYDEEKSVMMAFKDIDEDLIVGPKGFYVEEVTSGYWKCNACNANNLPMNNLRAHVNGKSHKKKINSIKS